MSNTAKCPNCEEEVDNIHYELHGPALASGYRGSDSFTSVAFPCGHVIGAVPVTWEMRLEEIDRNNREIAKKLEDISRELIELLKVIKNQKLNK